MLILVRLSKQFTIRVNQQFYVKFYVDSRILNP